MNAVIVQSQDAITLVGGGPVRRRDLALAMVRAPCLVAADSGADRLLAAGVQPRAVIGDMDSLSAAAHARLPAERLFAIAEQETTDFDKALRSVAAPFVLALGVLGARLDHALAALNALVRHRGAPCLLISPDDVVFHAPPGQRLQLRLGIGDRLSLFPLAEVRGESIGLHWPINGLGFAPGGMIGTSNRVSARDVELSFANPGMLVILPRVRLDAAIRALVPAWHGV